MQQTYTLGKFKITPIRDGKIWIDGGAMFNIVPRPVWSKVCTPDEHNRVPSALNSLLLQHANSVILIDAGVGDSLSSKQCKLYNREGETEMSDTLKNLRLSTADIDQILLTHMHFDRVGLLTYKREGMSKYDSTFPNAVHMVHQEEWDTAHSSNELAQILYKTFKNDVLYDAGVMDIFHQSSLKIIDGVTMLHTGGHSPGHCVVIVEDKDKKLIVLGDLVPTRQHLKLNWTSGYDYSPVQVVEQKKYYLDMVANTNCWVYLSQEAESPLGKIIKNDTGEYEHIPLEASDLV